MLEQRHMKRALVSLLTIAPVLLLAACGSSGSGTSASTLSTTTAAASAPATTSATTSASTSTSASTTTATSTVTATSSRPPPCRAAMLSLSFLSQQGGMGHGEIGFQLKNISRASCRTYGWPGILFLDRNGAALPTVPHHTTNDFFGSTPAAPLVIAPGASVSFRLDVGHGVATSNGCATAYGLQVIPPDDTATLRTTIPSGSYECRDANVSPLRPGDSAYP
jgi:hypothetical protein